MARPKPTILQIIPRLDAGGAERTTVDIAGALIAAGHGAVVVSEGGRLQPELEALGATCLTLPVASKNPLVLYRNIGRLARIIAEHGVALVHARSRAPAWSALYAAWRCDVPLVTTHHGLYGGGGRLKRLYNSVMVRGDAVIANSQWMAEYIRKKYPVAPKRLAVIPRGLDLAMFDPARIALERCDALRSAWGGDKEARIIFLPGRLTRWKGQLVLIEALSLLSQSGRLAKNVRAVIAGDHQGRDAYVAEMRSAISNKGLQGVVLISSHIADMAPAYAATDIVVSASTAPEPFGRIAIEAAAMGKPVIATDHGGARETVLTDESGLLVPPGDAAALADALGSVLALPEERLASMGAKGRAHIEANFTLRSMCAQTLALYAELLNAQRKS